MKITFVVHTLVHLHTHAHWHTSSVHINDKYRVPSLPTGKRLEASYFSVNEFQLLITKIEFGQAVSRALCSSGILK